MSSPAANPPPKNKAPDLPLWNRWWLFWKQVVSRFERKGGFIHASSLSYTTLVGLIPVLAVGLSVATSLMVKDGDEGQKEIEEWIDTMVRTVAPMLDLEVLDEAGDGDPEASGTATNEVAILEPPPSAVPENFPAEADPGQPDTIQPSIAWNHFGEKVMATGERRREVARQIAEYVERIHTGTIGVTSVCVFLVVAILLLRAIERTFNQVWEIPRNRSWGAGVAQYWAGLTLGPFLLILGTGLSSGSTAGHFMNYILEFGRLGNILIFILAWCITGSACALVYRIMTNTRVSFKAAAGGGMTAGFLLQLNSQLSTLYFSNVATANKIYGSLGAVPILLLGLYVSWIILIFGANVSYMIQFPNESRHVPEEALKGSGFHRILAAVRILQSLATRFHQGREAIGLDQLAVHQQLDEAALSSVVQVLIDGGLVFRGEGQVPHLTLAKPSDQITLETIFQVFEAAEDAAAPDGVELDDACIAALHKALDSRNRSASEIRLSDLMTDASPSQS